MKVEISKNAGFCFGVKKAVDAVYNNVNTCRLCTYGEIIHNKQVVNKFLEMGVKNIDNINNIVTQKDLTVVIRAHGVPKQVYDTFDEHNIKYIDATCPYVKKIHNMAQKYYECGYQIMIVGDREHPEVIGINGYTDNTAITVSNLDELRDINLCNYNQLCVVVQTTHNKEEFKSIIKYLNHLQIRGLIINDTICNATDIRQTEALELAKKADKMIVIGGSNSSNTKRLYEICRKHCQKTYLIEQAKDLDKSEFAEADLIGITAGASTPEYIIKEVKDFIEGMC